MSLLEAHKSALRQEMRVRLRAVSQDERQKAALGIAHAILAFFKAHCVRFVGSFASLPSEIDTSLLHQALLSHNIQVSISDPDNHKEVVFKPVVEHFDAILVPGLAFDLDGHRLGRGKGCYDRFIEKICLSTLPSPILIGLAYDFQIVSDLLVAPHDQKMHMLCTPQHGLIYAHKKTPPNNKMGPS